MSLSKNKKFLNIHFETLIFYIGKGRKKWK